MGKFYYLKEKTSVVRMYENVCLFEHCFLFSHKFKIIIELAWKVFNHSCQVFYVKHAIGDATIANH